MSLAIEVRIRGGELQHIVTMLELHSICFSQHLLVGGGSLNLDFLQHKTVTVISTTVHIILLNPSTTPV